MLTQYVITHKKINLKNQNKKKKLLLVGAYKQEKGDFNNYSFDDCGDNISKKNENYCELTGLYYIWKNDKSDFVSFEHYRRFFVKKQSFFKYTFLDEEQMIADLRDNDIILPTPLASLSRNSLFDSYVKFQTGGDIILLKKIIEDNYPDYLPFFISELEKKNYASFFNMFITSKNILNQYCEWLFSLFDILSSKISLDGRSDYEKRVFGFLSERLINVWVKKNKLRIKYRNVVNVDKSPLENKIFFLRRYLKRKDLK